MQTIIRWEKYLTPYVGVLDGREIIEKCFLEHQYSVTLWNKIYRTSLCKKAIEYIDDEYVVGPEDNYTYFILAFFAGTYYGLCAKRKYYCYSCGTGITLSNTGTITLKKVIAYYTVDKKIKDFLQINDKENAYERAWEHIHNNLYSAVLTNFDRIDDRERGLRTLIEYCNMKQAIGIINAIIQEKDIRGKREVQQIYDSWSYRVGAIVTFIPRKIVGWIRKTKRLRD